MDSRGCHVFVYVLKFAADTEPSSNPAKVLPVFGIGLAIRLQPGRHVVEIELAAGLTLLIDSYP